MSDTRRTHCTVHRETFPHDKGCPVCALENGTSPRPISPEQEAVIEAAVDMLDSLPRGASNSTNYVENQVAWFRQDKAWALEAAVNALNAPKPVRPGEVIEEAKRAIQRNTEECLKALNTLAPPEDSQS